MVSTDNGIIVAYGNTLRKYDKDLNVIKEVDLDMNVDAMQALATKFAKKYSLTFPLASDAEKTTAAAYGTWVEKSMYGRKYMGMERSTFLVDAKGKIAHVWRKVKIEGHAAEVLTAVRGLT